MAHSFSEPAEAAREAQWASLAAHLLGLSAEESEVLRKSVGRDTACRRWLTQKPKKGIPGLYFMPNEFRNGSSHLEQTTKKDAVVETRETHPPLKEEGMFQVGVFPCKGKDLPVGTTDGTAMEPGITQLSEVEQNTPDLYGVSLLSPSLNGETDAFWQIVKDHPNDLPAQLANKLYSATGRNISGAQIKALIEAGPPDPDPVHTPLPW